MDTIVETPPEKPLRNILFDLVCIFLLLFVCFVFVLFILGKNNVPNSSFFMGT